MLAPEDFATRCNELLERASSNGASALSRGERVAYDANRFLFEYESAGLSGFLYNISPTVGETSWRELMDISDSLRNLGCIAVADELASLEPALATANRAGASTWGEFCAAVGEERLSQADYTLGQQVRVIWAQLERFVSELPSHGEQRRSVA